MKKLSLLTLVVVLTAIFAIPAYAAWKMNPFTGKMDYYESGGFTSSSITSLASRADTSAGSLDAALCLWNTNGTNYKMTGENFLDWLTQEGFGSITDVDLLPGDTVDDDLIDLAILPATLSTTGHTHTTTTISGIDIGDDTNLTGTANQITLTGDTLSLATAITLPGTLTGGGIILGDSSPDADGEMGYATNAFSWFANSEEWSLTASADTLTWGTSTGIATIDFGSMTINGGQISASTDLLVGDDILAQDDLQLDSDAAIVFFGEDNEVTITHVADTGLLLNAAMQWQFRDSGIHIESANDGHLDLTADTSIDLNGYVVISSSMTAGGGGFVVDSDGDTTFKSMTITRVNGIDQFLTIYERPDNGDNYLQWAVKSNLTGSASLEIPTSLPSTDGLIPSWTSMGLFDEWVSSSPTIADNSVTPAKISSFTRSELIPFTASTVTDGSTAPDAVATHGAWKYRNFDGAQTEDVKVLWQIPADASTSDLVKYRVHYICTATTGDGGIAFSMAGVSIGDTDATGGSAGTAVIVTDDLSSGYAQWDYGVTAWSDAVTVTNAAAGEMVEFTFFRDHDHASDTYEQLLGVAFIEIQYTQNPQ